MKRIILCIFVIILPILASAQINKNQYIWTGSIRSEFSRFKQSKIQNPIIDFGAEASATYFVRDGLAVGLGISGDWFENHTTEVENDGYEVTNRSRSGSLIPYVRKYWKLASFIVYAGGGVSLSGDRSETFSKYNYDEITESSRSSFSGKAITQLGAILPISERLGLDISAQSALFPISFNTLKVGLVVLSGAGPIRKSTGEIGHTSPLTRGRWIVSGTFSTAQTEDSFNNGIDKNNQRRSATSISLSAGTFVQDRLLIGTQVKVGLQDGAFDISSDAAGFLGRNPILVGIRPYVRKYIGSARLAPYLQGNLGYERIMAGAPATNTFDAGANIGLAYIFGKNLLVEANLVGLSGGYSVVGNNSGPAPIASLSKIFVDFEAGLQPAFTLTYVFP